MANGEDDAKRRISDLERLAASLVKANRHLLRAQVIMHERQETFEKNLNRLTNAVEVLAQKVDALAEKLDALAQKVDSLAETQKAQGERVDKLVSAIGALVQRLPAGPQ